MCPGYIRDACGDVCMYGCGCVGVCIQCMRYVMIAQWTEKGGGRAYRVSCTRY